MNHSKKIGFIIRHAPYGNHFAQESLDAILASSVYGQILTLIFMGDGVLQLLENQQPKAIQQKSLQKQFSAFELYDITRLFVCQNSLCERSIEPTQLLLPATQIEKNDLTALLHEQDSLLSF